MRDGADNLTQVSVTVGSCTITVSGPLPAVVPLLNHLQAFQGEEGLVPPYGSPDPLQASGPSVPAHFSLAAASDPTPRTPDRLPRSDSSALRPPSGYSTQPFGSRCPCRAGSIAGPWAPRCL